MEKLTVMTTFSGIGMQERGIVNSGQFDMEVVGTSDIDKNAILSYAAIHNGLTPELVRTYDKYPSKEEMVSELVEKNIGYDFVKQKAYDWKKIANKKDDYELKKYWLAVHLSKNLGDISKIKRLPYADMLTFSFPCTDLSVAGAQKGCSYEDWKNGASTRSGLVWEIIRLLDVAKENNELPKYLLLENVSALLSKKFVDEFNNLNALLDDIGYNTYYKEINGKNTGVPQNRPRVFGIYIRKDIDMGTFEFPKPFDKGIRLIDVLEEDVPDKYYLSQQICDRFVLTDRTFSKNVVGNTKPETRTIGERDTVYNPCGIMGSLCATDYKQPKQILLSKDSSNNLRPLGNVMPSNHHAGNVYDSNKIAPTITTGNHGLGTLIMQKDSSNKCHMIGEVDIKGMDSIKRVYAEDGIAPTLTTMQGGHRQPKVIREISNANKLLNMVISENEIDGRVACDKSLKDPKIIDVANCITARYDNGIDINYGQKGVVVIDKDEDEDSVHYYIRKLTPKECFILMGLTADDCQACIDVGESDVSLYKQAGNGIITNCIKLIMEHLYKAQYDESFVCEDENY